MNYCSVVWGNASSIEVRRLQNTQNKAARIVLRWRYGSSVAVMRSVVGWSSNNKIIEKNMLILLYTSFKTAKFTTVFSW